MYVLWKTAPVSGASLSLKLPGQEHISCFWFLKGEKRDGDTCNTEKSPVSD